MRQLDQLAEKFPIGEDAVRALVGFPPAALRPAALLGGAEFVAAFPFIAFPHLVAETLLADAVPLRRVRGERAPALLARPHRVPPSLGPNARSYIASSSASSSSLRRSTAGDSATKGVVGPSPV